jgi:hypothetical protein
MKIKFKGEFHPVIFVLIGGFLVFIIMGYIAAPGMIYQSGFSYGYRWQLPYSSTGRLYRKTITKKTRDLGSKMFYAKAGEQIAVTRDLTLEDGNIYNSFWKYRIWPPDDVQWSVMTYESTSDTVVLDIEESGFYYFRWRIRKFEGEVRYSWEKMK